MNEKKAEREELKKFLEEKINGLKKELEYYEYLLALIESNFMKPLQKNRDRDSEVIEVKSNRKTIAIISKDNKAIALRMLFNAKKDPEIIAFLKKQINLLDPQAKLSIEEEHGAIREIMIDGFAGGNAITSGIIETLKIATVELYKKTPKK